MNWCAISRQVVSYQPLIVSKWSTKSSFIKAIPEFYQYSILILGRISWYILRCYIRDGKIFKNFDFLKTPNVKIWKHVFLCFVFVLFAYLFVCLYLVIFVVSLSSNVRKAKWTVKKWFKRHWYIIWKTINRNNKL